MVDARPIAVIGATGRTGSRVVTALRARNAPVRALSRAAPSDGTVDLRDAASVRRALEGARAVFVVVPAFAPDEATMIGTAARAAADVGVERVVLNSVLHPHTTTLPHHLRKADGEDAVRRCGVPWTILQPGMYAQSIPEIFEPLGEGDRVPVPWDPAQGISVVHLGDLAEVAASALLDDGHAYASYELAGPEPLGMDAMVEQLGALTGRALRTERIDPEAISLPGLGAAEAADFAAMCREYDAEGFPGNPRVLAALLDRAPTSFAAAIAADRATISPASTT